MKTAKTTLIIITLVIFAACSSSKKSLTSVSTTPASTTAVTAPATIFLVKPADGIYAPGDAELTAIQAQYKDVTLEKLKEGHLIYTQGACIQCHGALNIYKRGEEQWKNIIEDMAQRAKISDEQKDAVYKYVFAIKATQPK